MSPLFLTFFFFNDTATTEIYTLSLHDALPISSRVPEGPAKFWPAWPGWCRRFRPGTKSSDGPSRKGLSSRSEEHTSELQSRLHLVCRLLLEKKKKTKYKVDQIART